MPQKLYGPSEEITYHTNVLKSWTGAGCTETGTLTTTNSETPVRVVRSQAEGQTTPGWRKMMNSGVILPMTYWQQDSYTGNSHAGTRGWCTSANRKGLYVDYYYPGNVGILGWNTAALVAEIGDLNLQYYVQKAASSIYTSGWDAATFIAEITQLRRMLTGVGDKISDLSRGRLPGELHNLWLEGRYGWRTLRYDIQDFIEVLSRTNERRTRYRQASGGTDSGSTTFVVDSGSNPSIRDTEHLTWTVNMRGTVVADIDVPDFQFNPITTAWEVTKLSFVVDWLLNVGQALEAASFLLMAKSYKACTGFRVDFNLEGSSVLLNKGTNISAFHTGSWDITASRVERSPATVSALPRLKLRLDEYKVIDLLALVLQRLR